MEGPEFHRRQRRRIEVPVVPAPVTTIYDLNNDILASSHSLLGIGHFRYAGMACKLLLEASRAASDEKVTNMKIVTSSIACAEKYFEDEGTNSTTNTEQLKLFWYSAARYGRLEIMEWAHRQGYALVWSDIDIAVVICGRAAKYGHLNVLQWLRENGCPWSITYYDAAARGGHLSCLQWLRENGCPWNVDTACFSAVRGGHLPCLQWLRENGCPWFATTCAAAAEYGHLSILKWLRENGCPWNAYTYQAAARGGHLSILKWLRENRMSLEC